MQLLVQSAVVRVERAKKVRESVSLQRLVVTTAIGIAASANASAQTDQIVKNCMRGRVCAVLN